jgi:hypothetical protein
MELIIIPHTMGWAVKVGHRELLNLETEKGWTQFQVEQIGDLMDLVRSAGYQAGLEAAKWAE